MRKASTTSSVPGKEKDGRGGGGEERVKEGERLREGEGREGMKKEEGLARGEGVKR